MLTAIKKYFSGWFDWYREIPASSLAFYRICFGALMLFSTGRFLLNGWVYDFYIAPEFHFSYYGFDWIPYPNATTIYLIFSVMILSSVLIILGLFYRIASISFFVLFTYVELLDKTTYLNHYYFVSLIALLMIFLPANRYFSMDQYFGLCKTQNKIFAWQLGILKFQMGIVYVFAGIAKLGSDWLIEAQPLKIWLHSAHHWPLVGNLFKEDWVAYFFSWTGCVFDLFIIFFLLGKRTRNYAYLFVLFFHTLTWLLFPIGVFPWVMMVGTIIFLSPDLHTKAISLLSSLLSYFKKPKEFRIELPQSSNNLVSKLGKSLLVLFIAFQIVFPFRFSFYKADLFWAEQGFRFSWRVMLMEKAGYGYFYLHDAESGVEWEVPTSSHLSKLQEKQMFFQPDMILQYAHYLQTVYADTTIQTGNIELTFKNPEIRAEIYVTLNGRPSKLFVSKEHNLAAIDVDLSERTWLEPFQP